MPKVTIISGDHIPPIPYMIVDNVGMQVDLSGVKGELWGPTVARVEYGMTQQPSGKIFGRVVLKNGQGRTFWDPSLIQPYLAAYITRWTEEKAKHADNVRRRATKRMQDLMKSGVHDGMARAALAQAMRAMGAR
jgi:hypothetical protein